jgi:hypothetical protein
VLTEPEITDLIFVRGFDILPSLPQHARLTEQVEPRLRETADALGLPLHVVETNVRELADPLLEWQSFNNSVLCAVAHFFEELFERVVIPTDTDHGSQVAPRARGGSPPTHGCSARCGCAGRTARAPITAAAVASAR